MGDYRELHVWRRAHALTLAVYRATLRFPETELYGLTSQLRRACASVPANLAEGAGRNSDTELARFCRIALGSANEVEYHLLLARDLNYMGPSEHRKLSHETREIRRMLAKLIQKLATSRADH